MLASTFVGTSVDGFIARLNGEFDFLPPGGGGSTATGSSWRRWTRSSSAAAPSILSEVRRMAVRGQRVVV